jgi:hypothetical protein
VLLPCQRLTLDWGCITRSTLMPKSASTQIAVIGIDIGKNSFHVVGHDKRGSIPAAPEMVVRTLRKEYGDDFARATAPTRRSEPCSRKRRFTSRPVEAPPLRTRLQRARFDGRHKR